MKYKILDARTTVDLEALVRASMMQGWEAQGGVAVVETSEGIKFMQAVVMEEK